MAPHVFSLFKSAIERNSTKSLQRLILEKHLKPDCRSRDRETPLMHAASLGRNDCIKLLLRHSADVNKTDVTGSTALFRAAEMKHFSTIRLLIVNGATDIHRRNKDGQSVVDVLGSKLLEIIQDDHILKRVLHGKLSNPLLYFVGMNDLDDVQKILDYGAVGGSVHAKFGDPMCLAVSYRNRAIVDVLLNAGLPFDRVTKPQGTPLICAAKTGDVDMVNLFIHRKAEIDLKNDLGQTALFIACRHGHDFVARMLHGQGADITLSDYRSVSTLMAACHRGYTEVVTFLVEKGAAVNEVGTDRETPLTVCARRGDIDSATELLDAGADVNHECCEGTALILAVRREHGAMVDLLLSRGADVNFQTPDGFTPLIVACMRKTLYPPRRCYRPTHQAPHPDILRSLLQCSPDLELGISKPLYVAVNGLLLEHAELLLQAGALQDDPETEDGSRYPLLTSARLEATPNANLPREIYEDSTRWPNIGMLKLLLRYMPIEKRRAAFHHALTRESLLCVLPVFRESLEAP